MKGKRKSSKLLHSYLVSNVNVLRANIVWLPVSWYHTLVMFMFIFSTLVKSYICQGVVLRILLHLCLWDKVEVAHPPKAEVGF